MAFYNQDPRQGRQSSFDQSMRPGWPMEESLQREYNGSMHESGQGSTPVPEEVPAFRSQFEEVDRAHDNLAKGSRQPMPMMHGRRESVPMMGQFAGQFPQDQRMGPPRHHSVSEYEGMRSSPSSSSIQGYLANQRFGTPRQNEQESMLQAKRRAAAQRERELRNYHQEQQYNRGGKTDRSNSPNAMSEDDRRELIARQHKALYGESSNLYEGGPPSRPMSQDARVLAASGPGHSNSPGLGGYDHFGHPSSSSAEGGAAVPTSSGQGSRSRSNSVAPQKDAGVPSFGMLDNNRPTSASPVDGPPAGAIGAIGSRIPPGQKRTPPEGQQSGVGGQSNTSAGNTTEKPSNLGWGAGSAPWGGSSKPSLDQASVWG